jgi:hypothetical protein
VTLGAVPVSLMRVSACSTLVTFAQTLISTLINGFGRYAGGPTSQLAVVSVKKGRRYRYVVHEFVASLVNSQLV